MSVRHADGRRCVVELGEVLRPDALTIKRALAQYQPDPRDVEECARARVVEAFVDVALSRPLAEAEHPGGPAVGKRPTSKTFDGGEPAPPSVPARMGARS